MKLSEYIKEFGDKQVDVDKLSEFIIEDVEKVFEPKENEKYYYVNDLGKVGSRININDDVDEAITSSRQVYRTEEEAEFARDKAIFLEFMRKEFLRNSDVLDWKDEYQLKYYLEYNHFAERVDCEFIDLYQVAEFHTTNKNWLEVFIDDHYDEIKKYYFGVNDDE